MKSPGSLRGVKRRRPYMKRLIEEATPEPILRWRDISHHAMMNSGVCMICFGFVDDPRHTERLSTIFRFDARSSIFALRS